MTTATHKHTPEYDEARKAYVEAGKAYDEAWKAYVAAGKAYYEARKACGCDG